LPAGGSGWTDDETALQLRPVWPTRAPSRRVDRRSRNTDVEALAADCDMLAARCD